MTESGCHSAPNGEALCATGQRCTCSEQQMPAPIALTKVTRSISHRETPQPQQLMRSKSIRSVLWVGVACLTSPCCTPLFVPLALALLAGTPIALWLTAVLGWVYGILTLISVCSLLLAFRSLSRKPSGSSWFFKGQK